MSEQQKITFDEFVQKVWLDEGKREAFKAYVCRFLGATYPMWLSNWWRMWKWFCEAEALADLADTQSCAIPG